MKRFLYGLAVGLVVGVLGAALTLRGGKETTESSSSESTTESNSSESTTENKTTEEKTNTHTRTKKTTTTTTSPTGESTTTTTEETESEATTGERTESTTTTEASKEESASTSTTTETTTRGSDVSKLLALGISLNQNVGQALKGNLEVVPGVYGGVRLFDRLSLTTNIALDTDVRLALGVEPLTVFAHQKVTEILDTGIRPAYGVGVDVRLVGPFRAGAGVDLQGNSFVSLSAGF